MTSVLQMYDQISTRIRYFLATQTLDAGGETNVFLTDQACAMIYLPPGTVGPSTQIVNQQLSSLPLPTPGPPFAQTVSVQTGMLVRDTGRQLLVYSAATGVGAVALLVCKFREVVPQTSLLTEGATQSGYWIKVWQADGLGPGGEQLVYFTRTG